MRVVPASFDYAAEQVKIAGLWASSIRECKSGRRGHATGSAEAAYVIA